MPTYPPAYPPAYPPTHLLTHPRTHLPTLLTCLLSLLELSKSFLDPFGNRRISYSGLTSDISVDCLIGESNAGSLVWPQGAKHFPFDEPRAPSAPTG